MHDKYGVIHDPLCYPNSSILINLLDIRDADELEKVEANLTYLRAELFEPDFSQFNLAYLCQIHYYLFQDIYAWAGILRNVDISKGQTRFCSSAFIEKESTKLFKQLADENYLINLSKTAFTKRLVHYFCELNVIHPFREGNGRAQRLFFEILIANAGFSVDWDLMSKHEWIQGNIAGYTGDLSLLEKLFTQIILSP